MIEVTEEMRQAFADAAGWPPAPWMFGPDVERGIAAVLALVERDYPATEYAISALPEGDSNGSSFQIEVSYRGSGLWAVYRHGLCLGRDREWCYESVPSERTDEWLAEHRFPLAEALRLAREELPKLRLNGMTAAEVAAAWAEERRTARL